MSHRRPSDDLEETDTIAAYCVDETVLWFGFTIENALAERVNRGTQKAPRYEDRYTLSELLDPAFRLPRPAPQFKTKPQQKLSGFAAMLAMAQQPGGGVKMWTYVPPEATLPN